MKVLSFHVYIGGGGGGGGAATVFFLVFFSFTRVSLAFIYLRFFEIYFWKKNPKAESVWHPPPRAHYLTSGTKRYKTKHLAAKL